MKIESRSVFQAETQAKNVSIESPPCRCLREETSTPTLLRSESSMSALLAPVRLFVVMFPGFTVLHATSSFCDPCLILDRLVWQPKLDDKQMSVFLSPQETGSQWSCRDRLTLIHPIGRIIYISVSSCEIKVLRYITYGLCLCIWRYNLAVLGRIYYLQTL